MPAILGRIPGILVLGYIEVSEFFFQMSMRLGAHILAKLTLGHKGSGNMPITPFGGPDGPGFPKCSTFWSSILRGITGVRTPRFGLTNTVKDLSETKCREIDLRTDSASLNRLCRYGSESSVTGVNKTEC